MKITAVNSDLPAIFKTRIPYPKPDLFPKPTSRKPRRKPSFVGGGLRLRRDRDGFSAGKRSRPGTPLLRWKFEEDKNKCGVDLVDDDDFPADVGRKSGRRVVSDGDLSKSARKLAAQLWRSQLPQVHTNRDNLGFQSATIHLGNDFHSLHNTKPFDRRVKDLVHSPRPIPGHRDGFVGKSAADHSGTLSPSLHNGKLFDRRAKDLVKSPHFISGQRNLFSDKIEPSFYTLNSAMEGATKWDPSGWKFSEEVKWIYGDSKLLEEQVGVGSKVSALELELKQAQVRILELEADRRSSKKKLEQFLKKLNEEKLAWRSREHEKIRAIICDIKGELNREKKNCQRLEIINSKLVNELADVKSSAKRFMQGYEKERKARGLVEEVCDELAKEIGEDKAEVETLKRETMKMREELDDERRMLQMAEVWREERVQMKLVDAKVTLEEKFAQMNMLIECLKKFLNSKGVILDEKEMRKAEALQKAAASVNLQEFRNFRYERPNSDDIFSVFEDVNFGEANVREIHPSAVYSPASHKSMVHAGSPETSKFKKNGVRRYSNADFDHNGDMEEDDNDDESGWETVSNPDDQGSSYSPNESNPSVSNNHRFSAELEKMACAETPITVISEVCAIPTRQLKKVSSISRLWKSSNGDNYKYISMEGMNGKLSDGRLSNGSIISSDMGSVKGELSFPDLADQSNSPEPGNPQVTRGLKGCMEWPRGMQRNSLKAKLMEARMGSEKVQLRQVLKQKC